MPTTAQQSAAMAMAYRYATHQIREDAPGADAAAVARAGTTYTLHCWREWLPAARVATLARA